MKKAVIFIILLGIFTALVISSVFTHSGTSDEIAHHIPGGYVILETLDFKIDTSHPPLSRYIAALPLKMFIHPNLPLNKSEWRVEDRSVFGKKFFFELNKDSKKILFTSRMGAVLTAILCAIILFLFTRKLYSEKCAYFALFLYVFCPNIIAHSSLSTTDIATTCFMLLSIFSFWNFLENPDLKNTLFCGLSLGLAELCKYSLLILYPIYILFVFWKMLQGNTKKIFLKYLIICLLSVFVIWAGYGFEFSPILKDAMRQKEKLDLIQNYLLKISPGLNPSLISNFLLNVPVILGAHIIGVLGIFKHSEIGHSIYFFGAQLDHGNKLYFLAAYLLKTPLPGIIFFFTSLFCMFKKRISVKEVYLLSIVLTVFLGASFSNLQLGLRYILPVYPILFILSSSALEFWLNKSKRIVFIILAAWYILSVALAWPNYLSYFNEIAGGPNNGWKYLRDSNLDWGQDLPALSKFIKEHNIKDVTLDYFGQDNPEVYGIKFLNFSAEDRIFPKNKVYAISVNYLENTQWTKTLKPTSKAGYSIFIYDLRK